MVSGQFVSCDWGIGELRGMRDRVVKGDFLEYRIVV